MNLPKARLKGIKWLIFLFLLSLLAYTLIVFLEKGLNDPDKVAKHLSDKMDEKQIALLHTSDKIWNSLELEKLSSDKNILKTLFGNEFLLNSKYGIYFYENSDLLFWNNSEIIISDSLTNYVSKDIRFLKLENGYFLVHCSQRENYKLLVLDLVYTNYPFQNNFLDSHFNSDFGLAADGFKISESQNLTHQVVDKKGHVLFNIEEAKQRFEERNATIALIEFFLVLFILSLLYLLIFRFYKQIGFFLKHKNLKFFSIAADILFIQLIIRLFGYFILDFDSDLFQPALFSSGFIFPSLGLLLLHLHALLFIAISFFNDFSISLKSRNKYIVWIKLAGISFLIQLIFLLFVIMAERIFYHAAVPLSFIQFYAQNIWSYSLFLAISFLVISTMLFSLRLISEFFANDESAKNKTILFISIALLNSIWFNAIQSAGFYLTVFIIIFYFISLSTYLRQSRRLEKPATFLLMFALCSALLTIVIYKVNTLKSEQEQLLTAHKLSVDSDPMLEFLFPEISQNIHNDSLLQLYINRTYPLSISDENAIYASIKKRYLSGYFDRYTIEQTLCTDSQQLIVQPENITVNCADYFNELIVQKGQKTLVKGLYLINDNVQGIYYLAEIQLDGAINGAGNRGKLNLFIEFYYKYIPEGLGYPELLIDESKGFTREFANYSFATYQNGILIYKFGSYLYPARLDDLPPNDTDFFTLNGYKHIKQVSGNQKIVIVSKKVNTIIDNIAPFSFFFFIIVIVGLIVLFSTNFKQILPDFSLNFRMKLQLLILTSLLLSFIIIGISTIYYITDVYNKKNNDFLNEKTQSILIELEHKLGNEDLNRPGINDYLQQLLLKFSMVFFSDINIFDLDGRLIASSRYEIFDKGLISSTMNPIAYKEMRIENTLFFLHQEQIGEGKYMSSYIPFKGADGNPKAYINLPYFARETEISNEVSSLVLAYINVFLLLTGISVVMALILSRRLTQPLQMVQQKMQMVRIDKKNEKIAWKGKDEIGQLVNQYNILLDQLVESAELLARSERESAWREMAKQVAHEIKNPLTPMRLSAQYLLKAWHENDPDIGQKVERTTQTLIDQIDTLSSIASAFSDFANMPLIKPERILISHTISQIVTLFDNSEFIRFEIKDTTDGKCEIFADPGNTNRVFTNIIKNSIQAIGNKKDGLIDIRIAKLYDTIQIDITDNGKGMSAEEEMKVFTPNFTTKTSGMGIGLSIVRNLLIAAGGSISFETKQGVMTVFHIVLPLAK